MAGWVRTGGGISLLMVAAQVRSGPLFHWSRTLDQTSFKAGAISLDLFALSQIVLALIGLGMLLLARVLARFRYGRWVLLGLAALFAGLGVDELGHVSQAGWSGLLSTASLWAVAACFALPSFRARNTAAPQPRTVGLERTPRATSARRAPAPTPAPAPAPRPAAAGSSFNSALFGKSSSTGSSSAQTHPQRSAPAAPATEPSATPTGQPVVYAGLSGGASVSVHVHAGAPGPSAGQQAPARGTTVTVNYAGLAPQSPKRRPKRSAPRRSPAARPKKTVSYAGLPA